MAKVTSLIFQGASGRMGNIVFATRKGKTYMRFAPTRRANNKPTSKQLQVLNNFKEASMYARYITQNPELAKIYEADTRKGKSVYQLAMQDALRSPIVRSINTDQYHGLPEDEIFIYAIDDFMVKTVLVTIVNEDGDVIEQGEAVQSVLSFSWVYEARVENPYPRGCTVRVTAKDLAGNVGSLQSVI